MTSPYTGNPTGAQSPASAPGPGVAPIVSTTVDGDPVNAAEFNQGYKVLADYVAYLMQQYSNPNFGDGSDGAVVFDGTTTVLGLVPSIGAYVMTRDIYCSSIVVTGAGTQLLANGYRIYCKGMFTTAAGGVVNNNGAAGVVTTPGAGGNIGTIGSGQVGGVGGSGSPTTGSPGGNSAICMGASGGLGGTGNSGAIAGGTGGTATVPTANNPGIRLYSPLTFGYTLGAGFGSPFAGNNAYAGIMFGGPGGGGGAHGGASNGGGGGAGGGIVAIAARSIVLAHAADLQAAGGPGGPSFGAGAGGGGGGAGGLVMLAYQYISAASGTLNSATCAPGGIGGTTSGAGVAGATGGVGFYLPIPLA